MSTEEHKKSRSLIAAERREAEAAEKATRIRAHETLMSKLELATKLARKRDYEGVRGALDGGDLEINTLLMLAPAKEVAE